MAVPILQQFHKCTHMIVWHFDRAMMRRESIPSPSLVPARLPAVTSLSSSISSASFVVEALSNWWLETLTRNHQDQFGGSGKCNGSRPMLRALCSLEQRTHVEPTVDQDNAAIIKQV